MSRCGRAALFAESRGRRTVIVEGGESRICILGLWHQGPVLAACFSDLGHSVVGVSDVATVARLTQGEPPVREPKLPGIIRRNLQTGRLHFTTDVDSALLGADFVFISFDTMVNDDDAPDTRDILGAAVRIGEGPQDDHPPIVIVTAQVPVGTCDEVHRLIRRTSGRSRTSPVVYVPEFLRLGRAVDTLRGADRFVVGASDQSAGDRVEELYSVFGRPTVRTDIRTAEMSKHASNSFLATSISFINEIADLCEVVQADVDGVVRVMRLDPRIGRQAFLEPGLGFAGGTLGRDVRALQAVGQTKAITTPVLDATMLVNGARWAWVMRQIRRIGIDVEGAHFGILGLAYKPGTNTLRRSVALQIAFRLTELGASIRAFDPLTDDLPSSPEIEVCADPYSASAGCDALLVLNTWPAIQKLDFARIRSLMRRPVIIDARHAFEAARMREMGFEYSVPGRARAD